MGPSLYGCCKNKRSGRDYRLGRDRLVAWWRDTGVRRHVEHTLKPLVLGENLFDREHLYNTMLGRATSSYAFGQKGVMVTVSAGVDLAL